MSPVKNEEWRGIPDWLENVTLHKAIEKSVGTYENILSFTVENNTNGLDCNAGNVPSKLRIGVELELADHISKSTAFILKTLPSVDSNDAQIKQMQKEEQMYQTILPKLEKLYHDAGRAVKLAPQAYTFDRDVGSDYVLLEDLSSSGYKNVQALEFDLEHMRKALRKLAEFHAASACYVEHFGGFGASYTASRFPTTNNRDAVKELIAPSTYLAQMKKWKGNQEFYKKLAGNDNQAIDRLLAAQIVKPHEFNVLNHGDCWANNVMFQYDDGGKILSTLFVDFQQCTYGSPALDLYYLILSTAVIDIKLSCFDALVRFYYDNLIASLKLLQYHRPLPKLKHLHTSLLRNGLAANYVVSTVLPLVILKSDHGVESLKKDRSKLQAVEYNNVKYIRIMSQILPWLDNRGLLDG